MLRSGGRTDHEPVPRAHRLAPLRAGLPCGQAAPAGARPRCAWRCSTLGTSACWRTRRRARARGGLELYGDPGGVGHGHRRWVSHARASWSLPAGALALRGRAQRAQPLRARSLRWRRSASRTPALPAALEGFAALAASSAGLGRRRRTVPGWTTASRRPPSRRSLRSRASRGARSCPASAAARTGGRTMSSSARRSPRGRASCDRTAHDGPRVVACAARAAGLPPRGARDAPTCRARSPSRAPLAGQGGGEAVVLHRPLRRAIDHFRDFEERGERFASSPARAPLRTRQPAVVRRAAIAAGALGFVRRRGRRGRQRVELRLLQQRGSPRSPRARSPRGRSARRLGAAMPRRTVCPLTDMTVTSTSSPITTRSPGRRVRISIAAGL